MQILPAIDIKNGRAVRLYKGDFEQETVVNDSPLAQAKIFAKAGMTYLHVVDLDGALDGRATSAPIIEDIVKQTGLKIEVGGGIRTLAQIGDYLANGVDRVIIGSMAVTDPDFVREALTQFGADRIVIGIDAKKGMVATKGWLETSDVDFITLALEMEKMGVRLFVYTDVDREQLKEALTFASVIASGGIAEVSDLTALADIGVTGTIVGKAYYNGNISLDELKEY